MLAVVYPFSQLSHLKDDARPAWKKPTSHVQSAKEVDPKLVVVKPFPQLLHVDVDLEPLNLPKGHTWQLGVVAKSRRQPLPAPQDGHWKMHSTTRSQDSHPLLELHRQPEEVNESS